MCEAERADAHVNLARSLVTTTTDGSGPTAIPDPRAGIVRENRPDRAAPVQHRPGGLVMPFVAAGDWGALFIISTLGLYLREGDTALLGWVGITLVATMLVVILANRGLYRLRAILYWPDGIVLFVLIQAPMAAIGWILATAPRQFTMISMASLVIAVVATALLSISLRFAVTTLVCRHLRSGRGRRRIAIIGRGSTADRLVAAMTDAVPFPARLVDVFDDRPVRSSDNVETPRPGGLDDLIQRVRDGWIDDVVVCLPSDDRERLGTIREALYEVPVHVFLAPDGTGRSNPCGYDDFVRLQHPPLADWRWVVKWIEDKAAAVTLVVLLVPVLALIAIAVKLESSGPLLFRQARRGFNNQPFTVYKFRTMEDDDGMSPFRQAERDDPRVTRVGWVLRRTSLDELAQLFNVLEGSMSMVGPRPHPTELDAEYAPFIPYFLGRYRVKPGITGQAQLTGYRGAIRETKDMEARIGCDLHYIDRWSVVRDLKILVLTAWFGWVHPRAY
jgi:Undecaprenyl-phosphate glucose phosphotransferase